MQQRQSIRALTFAVALSSVIAGCHKQPKPQPIVPPPSFPETAIIFFPEPLPPPGVAAVPPPQPAPSRTQARTTRPRPRNHSTEKKAPAISNPNGSSGNETTARNLPPRITAPGSVPDSGTTISPAMPHSDEIHHKLSTAQLIQSTEDNLKSLTRTLSNDDRSVIEQIRSFLAQSRSATAENDLVRAHNLALKAHLLSDELVRP
jgi:hypothetical protein